MRIFGRAEEEPPPQSRVGRHQPVSSDPRSSQPRPAHSAAGEQAGRIGPAFSEGMLLFLFAVVTMAAAAFVLWRQEVSADDLGRDRGARAGASSGERGGGGDGGGSFLEREGFARALERVAESGYPLVITLRVAPDQVVAIARNAAGERSVVTIGDDVRTTGSGEGRDAALPVERIDPRAVTRIVRALERRDVDAKAIDYMVLTAVNAERDSAWSIFVDSGSARLWLAAADGSDLHRVGETSRSARRRQAAEQRRREREREAALRRQRREQAKSRREFERRIECLRGAQTPAQAERCLGR